MNTLDKELKLDNKLISKDNLIIIKNKRSRFENIAENNHLIKSKKKVSKFFHDRFKINIDQKN